MTVEKTLQFVIDLKIILQKIKSFVVDVTDPEPLPKGDPLWSHPGVVLTPHVASRSRPDSAVKRVIDNIARLERGDEMQGLVPR